MNSPPSPLKPAQGASLFFGLIVAGAVFYGIYLLRAKAALLTELGIESDGWLLWLYAHASVSYYFPEALASIKDYPFFHWAASYLPVPGICLLITIIISNVLLNIVLEKPQSSLLDDPEYDLLHKGVQTPRINHLTSIMGVLPPRDRTNLMRDIALGVIDPFTPESKASDLADRPASLMDD